MNVQMEGEVVDVVSGSPWVVRVWAFEPDEDEREQLGEGARLVVAVACMEPPELQVKVAPPICAECGFDMRWEPRLKTFTCEHEEESDGGPV